MSEGDICEVIFNNDTSVVSLLDYLILAGDEPSPQFMYSIIGKTPQPFPPLLDVLNAYKSQYYISGEKLKNQILYKIYSRTPLTCQSRNTYNASWIDYEKQLKDGNIIYDEGITPRNIL